MRRRISVSVVMVGLLVAAGCVAPLPPGHQPPTIESLVVSPNPVVAGESFTVSVVATDDVAVIGLEVQVIAPHLDEDHTPIVPCEVPAFEWATVVAVDIVCSMPAFAPSGTWPIRVGVRDRDSFPSTWSSVAVTGGSDDDRPPVLESAVVSPDPVVVGEPFTITVQVSDEHPLHPYPTVVGLPFPQPVTLRYYAGPPGQPGYYWECAASSYDFLSPTLQQWQLECPANPDPDVTPGRGMGLIMAGLHHPYTGYLEDAIGNRLRASFPIDFVGAP